MKLDDCFSGSYAQARRKFLDAAADAGLQVESRIHPERGRDGEELAMDVVRDGPVDATALLVLSSACHGVEGFCGSGVPSLPSPAVFALPRNGSGVLFR